ncbi:MAG: Uma2 family endonuclease [Proteobacteria bacterium]|nr:Uma2 family endonuclease [Pseudomonadota bacterium]
MNTATATTPRPLTAHDLRELPEGPPYYQLIEGDLYMSPTPNLTHQRVVRNLLWLIHAHFQKHPVGEVVPAPSEVELSDLNVYEPDLYVVLNTRKSIFTPRGVTGAPDLVVEVLSLGTAKYDKGIKRQVYARCGVKELWLVDTDTREISAFHLQTSADKPAGVYAGKQKLTSPLLPGFKLALAEVFEK